MTSKLHAFVPTLVFACSVITSLLGCGDDSPGSGNDAAVSCDLATKAGDTVFLACASSYDLVVAGDGFQAPAPKGSACTGGESYHLNADKRTLDWTRCDATTDNSPWTQSHGSRALSAAELSSATSALKKVVVAKATQCGADKPTITLKVTTPDASKTYTDSFYSCDKARAPFVDNIDEAVGAFSALAQDDKICCLARAVCATGSTEFQSEADCKAHADSCTSSTLCCATIWCGTTTSDGGETDDASTGGDAG